MRPKVVIVTLLVAFGLLGILAALKGFKNKPNDGPGAQPPDVTVNGNASSGDTNGSPAQPGDNSSSPGTVSPELRAAIIAKEVDQVQTLVGEADGTNNPIIITALIDKVVNPEAEVRKAALAAVVQLGDTNAVTGLQKILDQVKDPRGKVEVMDTIDYLNLPSVMPAVQPPDTFSNQPVSNFIPQDKMNPKFLHKEKIQKPWGRIILPMARPRISPNEVEVLCRPERLAYRFAKTGPCLFFGGKHIVL